MNININNINNNNNNNNDSIIIDNMSACRLAISSPHGSHAFVWLHMCIFRKDVCLLVSKGSWVPLHERLIVNIAYRCLCKNTPPEKRTLGKTSLKSTKSGAGEGFLLLGCMAKATAKGMFLFTDTGRNRHAKSWHPLSLSLSLSLSLCNTDACMHAIIARTREQVDG